MRILNLMQCTNLGGTENASLRLMLGMRSLGHSFEITSIHPLGQFAARLSDHGFNARGLTYRGKLGWRSLGEVRRAVAASDAEALLMTGPTLIGIASTRCRAFKRRVLAVHYHHTGVHRDWVWRRIYRQCIRRFDHITFSSSFIRDEAIRIEPAVAQHSSAIMCPVPLPPLPTTLERSIARQRFGCPDDAFVIGNAGWLIERKRFDVFLKVCAEVYRQNTNSFFLIAGDGVQKEHLVSLANELGIDSRIRWIGWQADLSDFYKAIDVLLFNSQWDAMGLTALEAASHGRPVVASVINGGLDEVLCEVPTMTLLREHNIERLAEQCMQYAGDQEDRFRAGQGFRDAVARRCGVDVVAKQYEALFT